MTDRIDPKEIADELRGFSEVSTSARATLMRDAADTIDALVREMHARELHHFEVAQDRDALAAVVEKVRGVIGAEIGWESPAILIDRIQWALSTAPADALAEHDARLIEGLAADFGVVMHPYEGGTTAWLRERARLIREGDKK